MKSDIGSAIIDLFFYFRDYQEDLRTPGMSPSFAASRKQARHMPKSRMKARLRPQRKQRLTTREANFGVRLLRAIVDFLAIYLKKIALLGASKIYAKCPGKSNKRKSTAQVVGRASWPSQRGLPFQPF